MAEHTITVEFKPCEPAPANGYRIMYRPQGSIENFRVWPTNFANSPAVFVDTMDDEATEYEGFIMGDCGAGMFGVRAPWQTGENSPGGSPGGGSPPAELLRINNNSLVNITGVFTIPVDGEPGDSREVTCDGGYPVLPGQVRNGSIHADHNGDSNLSVLVFFSSIRSTFDRVHVTDSDNVEGCESGNGLAAVIGVTGPFRFNNAETWEVTANNTPC